MKYSYFTLFVALAISGVAEYYSIVGLTTLFPGAFWSIVIMGVCLGVGKITAATWLKINWDRSSLFYKLYLIPAVITLMFLTSIGCFGFLSKAHSDQSLLSGDVQAKIAIYDEKIKTSKENIEANRKSLKQMDEAVDQVMGRSSDEKGADKAISIRRGQAKERSRLQQEIIFEQNLISKLNEEAAPIRAEIRKVENETGPVKYIAALIYGDTTDTNMLEAAVRWVIIIIVAVFDPLALVLLLAAQQSFRWDREQKEEEDRKAEQEVSEFFDRGSLVARELDSEAEQQNIEAANQLLSEVEREVPEVILPQEPAYEPDDGPLTAEQIQQIKDMAEESTAAWKKAEVTAESDPTINCYKCDTELMNAPGIGLFCPNKACDVVDGPFNDEEPIEITYIPPAPINVAVEEPVVTPEPVVEETEIETENVTEEKIMFSSNEGHVTFEGKKMSIDSLKTIRPDLIMPDDGAIHNRIDFGTEFPKLSLSGDSYIRVDSMPHRVYKFNGRKWMNVDKAQNTTYLTNLAYIRLLIHKLEQNEYDPELLSYAEQDEIEAYLNNKKK